MNVVVDTSAATDCAAWAAKAKDLILAWHPKVAALLPSKGFVPPRSLRLVFKDGVKIPAYAAGRTIVVSADWIRHHPDDFGMIVHELTHVIQHYGRAKGERPGWLVEGIADYVRFHHYEPHVKNAVNPRTASYRDGYRTAARFLAWAEKTHDPQLVRKLNAALRAGTYRDELFRTYTARSLDELWADFAATLERRPSRSR